MHTGPIVSSALFYDPDAANIARWKRTGHLAIEMEAAMLYTVAAVHGIEALAMMTVSDLVTEEASTRDLRRRAAPGCRRHDPHRLPRRRQLIPGRGGRAHDGADRIVSVRWMERTIAGRYVLRGPLGTGGMADVFVADDVRLHRQVAVKLVPAAAITPTVRARFVHEARSAARIVHPNAVIVYDAGESQGFLYLVMERVSGHTLAEQLATTGPLPVHEAAAIRDRGARRRRSGPRRRHRPPRCQAGQHHRRSRRRQARRLRHRHVARRGRNHGHGGG